MSKNVIKNLRDTLATPLAPSPPYNELFEWPSGPLVYLTQNGSNVETRLILLLMAITFYNYED